MSIYTLILIFNKIIQILLTITFVILKCESTKEILIGNVKKEVEDFHSNYIQYNYHLDIANLNNLDQINEAMLYIKSEPDFFDRIPGEDILATNWYLSFINKYNSYQKGVLVLIGLTISIELGICVGLGLLQINI